MPTFYSFALSLGVRIKLKLAGELAQIVLIVASKKIGVPKARRCLCCGLGRLEILAKRNPRPLPLIWII
jgi:hypothetical protein